MRVLERLKAVDDRRFRPRGFLHHLPVEDQTLAAGAGEVARDRGVGDAEGAGDRADAGAGDGGLGDQGEEVEAAQPEPCPCHRGSNRSSDLPRILLVVRPLRPIRQQDSLHNPRIVIRSDI
jgi:hypothetical protein